MNMKTKINILLILVAMLSSCTLVTSYKQTNAKEYTPTDAKKVMVYSGIPNNIKFEPLAAVSVNAISEKKAMSVLKEEAADLGADAVIDAKVYVMSSDDRRCGISGVVVKLK